MNRLDELYKTTVELKELLDQKVTAKNRDEIIEQMTDLIEKRGEYLATLSPPYSDEENEYGKQIIELNQHIQEKMNALFAELKLEMKHVMKQRQSKQSYANPYQDVQLMDGMFLDSKQ